MLKPTTNHFIWHISDLIWACQVIQDNIKRAFEYVDLHLGPRSKSWSLVAAAQETTGYCWPRWRCWSRQVLSFLYEPWSKVGLCGMVINPLSWVLHTYYIQGFPCILTRLHLWRYCWSRCIGHQLSAPGDPTAASKLWEAGAGRPWVAPYPKLRALFHHGVIPIKATSRIND